MGSVSIDLSLSNIYKCWFLFKQGKKKTGELEIFSYYLEKNLKNLQDDLVSGNYGHGGYRVFEVCDNKRRRIMVASVKDRVVHRLVYEYLKDIYDKTFIFDAWSCRNSKGLSGAVKRTEDFLKKYQWGFVWRADVKKFFDSVDRNILLKIISRRIKDAKATAIINKIIFSYYNYNERERERESKWRRRGIPIGNLTSQIFANIYLNEFDRFIKHDLKPRAYLRYGDDFIMIEKDHDELINKKQKAVDFLKKFLDLELNSKNDIIVKANWGLKFLGAVIYPGGRRLNKRNLGKIKQKLNLKNLASYRGLVWQNQREKLRELSWRFLQKYDEEIF